TTDATADQVFGQPGFTTNDANHGGLSASSLYSPYNVALDVAGNLYVADSANNRVLEYDAPLITDRKADHVFGQPGFNTSPFNNRAPPADSLPPPRGLALEGRGNLYVPDFSNTRVVEYDPPLPNDRTADRIFAQPATSRPSSPWQVALDASGN